MKKTILKSGDCKKRLALRIAAFSLCLALMTVCGDTFSAMAASGYPYYFEDYAGVSCDDVSTDNTGTYYTYYNVSEDRFMDYGVYLNKLGFSVDDSAWQDEVFLCIVSNDKDAYMIIYDKEEEALTELWVEIEISGPSKSTGGKTCSYCGGGGRGTCLFCNGRGRESCSLCGGGGRRHCVSCGGKGYTYYDRSGEKERCYECDGTGRCACIGCDGVGYSTCINCGGSGKDTCLYCDGTGKDNS